MTERYGWWRAGVGTHYLTGPVVNVLDRRLHGLCVTYSALRMQHRQHDCELAWLGPKKTLLMDAEI